MQLGQDEVERRPAEAGQLLGVREVGVGPRRVAQAGEPDDLRVLGQQVGVVEGGVERVPARP
ncbi:hypothetical protein Daura_12110 [Dactylosporangium aurantiacum]|uniref:Uncharacterized protein n=1 Tax=Dactylosporangium aurantiacum TaxID=35754 RepID=A0A9Q9IIM3_9ACTN|nr:hypothetical protein [Dactylosporangium aurantiacum]MDG6104143.1 hypothetical protein [Dactylosporangium aurantiacum]UWZ56849.1 hypothetical protein Daura_12110 [Dactylosporangium aurantiacum]